MFWVLLNFHNYVLLPNVHFSFHHVPQYIGALTSSPPGSVFVGVKFQAPTSCKGTEASLPQRVSLFQGLNHGEMVWGQKGPLEGVYLRGSFTRPPPHKISLPLLPQPSLEPPRANPLASHRPWGSTPLSNRFTLTYTIQNQFQLPTPMNSDTGRGKTEDSTLRVKLEGGE